MKKVYLYNDDDEYLTTIRVPDETKYLVFTIYYKMVACYFSKPKRCMVFNDCFSLSGLIHELYTDKCYCDNDYCLKQRFLQYALKIEDD